MICRSNVNVHWRGIWRSYQLLRAGGPVHVIIDVDGCLTSGLQLIDAAGEKIKAFGLDDSAAIKRWRERVPVTLITSDMCMATIARANSWGMPLYDVPDVPNHRLGKIKDITHDPARTIYIADGYWDGFIMRGVGLGIAPTDAWPATRRAADVVTGLPGGRRAVAQALDWIGDYLL